MRQRGDAPPLPRAPEGAYPARSMSPLSGAHMSDYVVFWVCALALLLTLFLVAGQ